MILQKPKDLENKIINILSIYEKYNFYTLSTVRNRFPAKSPIMTSTTFRPGYASLFKGLDRLSTLWVDFKRSSEAPGWLVSSVILTGVWSSWGREMVETKTHYGVWQWSQ